MRKGAINTKCEMMIAKVNEKCFIQPAIDKEIAIGHEGYTHKLLSVPPKYNLSRAETLLERIVDTPIGEYVKNPLVIGRRSYKVTQELKRHVNFALNLIRISQGKGKRKHNRVK